MFSKIKKQKCLHCGANPTNHTFSRFASLIDGLVASLTPKLKSTRAIGVTSYGNEIFLSFFVPIWSVLGIAKWNSNIEKAFVPRGKVLWEEAKRRKIQMQNLMLFWKSSDIYRIAVHGRWFYFNGLPRFGMTSNRALSWIDDKAVIKQKLVEHGVPAPKGAGFFSYKKALALFETLQKPVIVKPRFGSRGRHTTTFISTPEDFKKGFKVAKQICPFVMVEEHVHGPVYRGTVIDGKLQGILSGEPPRITGDGIHTIAELVAEKNKTRDKRQKEVVMTDVFDTFLGRQKFTRETVLEKGKTIDLSEKIGVNYGGKSIDSTDEAHPKYAVYLEKAASMTGDPILGFDFITPDITKDPDTLHWGIIECNGMPFINLHYDPLVGKTRNVAAAVLDLMNE